jgi:hypothetical protein
MEAELTKIENKIGLIADTKAGLEKSSSPGEACNF